MLEKQPDLGGRENRDWGRLWVKDQCWAGAGLGAKARGWSFAPIHW